MSGHQEYQCEKCGFEWESLDLKNCPRCNPCAGQELRDFYKQEGAFGILKTLIESAPKEWLPGLKSVVIGICIKRGLYKLGHAWESVRMAELAWQREKKAFPEFHTRQNQGLPEHRPSSNEPNNKSPGPVQGAATQI